MPAIIEQKVTGRRRSAASATSSSRYGERGARARATTCDLWVQPDPDVLARDPVVGVAQAAHRPGPVAGRRDWRPGSPTPWSGSRGVDRDEADRRLRCLPGIGVWTSAEVRARALGDADAV